MKVEVPLVTVPSACVTLTGVYRKFLISSRVDHRFVAWPFFPHKVHGGVTLIVGVSCMMGDFNLG